MSYHGHKIQGGYILVFTGNNTNKYRWRNFTETTEHFKLPRNQYYKGGLLEPRQGSLLQSHGAHVSPIEL